MKSSHSNIFQIFAKDKNTSYVFDKIRKKNVLLTPEESVRQTCITFLVQEKSFPIQWINVEKVFKLYNKKKRYDVVVYKPNKEVLLLVECKAPNVKITKKTFEQIIQYNIALKTNFLMLTNGKQHFYYKIDNEKKTGNFIPELPDYNLIKKI